MKHNLGTDFFAPRALHAPLAPLVPRAPLARHAPHAPLVPLASRVQNINLKIINYVQ
jgi:hypothetical protein